MRDQYILGPFLLSTYSGGVLMHYVIVGNGVAGITAVKNLRSLDPEARITVFGDEPYYCYSRPRLIEMLGKDAELNNIYLYPPSWYYDQDIEVYLNVSVEQLELERQLVKTDCGQQMKYDKLLLATGSTPNLPPVHGADQDGVFTVRTVEDVREIQKYSGKGRRSIVIGGGLLGLETAYSLTKLEQEVVVVDRNPWLLKRQIDSQGSEMFRQKMEKLGVQSQLEGTTESIEQTEDGLVVNFKDGRKLYGDTVIFSAGVAPNTELAEQAGLKTDGGIIVDEYLRTSDSKVFAAGDAAEFQGKSYGIIPAAMEQGKLVAQNMVNGTSKEYQGTVPSTSLKIAGIDLVSLGEIYPDEDDRIVIEIDEQEMIYKKAVFRDNYLIGAILLGDKSDLPKINKLLRSQQLVSDPDSIFEQ